jgi:hypothetical protein
MASDEVLKVGLHACEACGLDGEAMRVALKRRDEQIEILREDVANLERDLRSKRAQIRSLKSDQDKALRTDPLFPAASSVLEHWKRTCYPTARELGGVRLENCLARLRPRVETIGEEKAVGELKASCDGYALKPYVVNGRRSPEGPHDSWHADAELIFRSDKHVTKGLQILQEAHRLTGAMAAAPSGRSETFERSLSPLGAAALRMAAHGFYVFPVVQRDKVPATRNGLNDASRDEGKIRACWAQHPHLNIGVRTGAESGIVVLDVDGDDGWDSYHALEDENEELPTTLSVTTPRGGQHFYFAHPGKRIRNSASLLGPALDVRGDGGYVLAPPSVGPNGQEYVVDEQVKVAPMPLWLIEAIESRQGKLDAALSNGDFEKFVMAGAGQGNRNDQMVRVVGSLMNRHDPADVAFLAHGVNVAHFKPPLPKEEVEKVVKSVIRMRSRAAA